MTILSIFFICICICIYYGLYFDVKSKLAQKRGERKWKVTCINIPILVKWVWCLKGKNCGFTSCQEVDLMEAASFLKTRPTQSAKAASIMDGGKPEPRAIKWGGLQKKSSCIINVPTVFSREKPRSECILGYDGPHLVEPSNWGSEGSISQPHLNES